MAKHTYGKGAIRHLSLRMINGGQDPLALVAPPVAAAPVAPAPGAVGATATPSPDALRRQATIDRLRDDSSSFQPLAVEFKNGGELRMANGGLFGGIKRALGLGPPETVTEKFARQDAERAAKEKPKAQPTPPAQPQNGVSNYVGNPALERRMKDAGLKHGGELKTGQGGAVPGQGKGDKIDAKYEPGEFVVSNDMLALKPGLREELHALRMKALSAKGLTPEQADRQAVKGGAIRAMNGLSGTQPVEDRDGFLPGESIGARAVRRVSGLGDGLISGLKAAGRAGNLGAPGAATGLPLNKPTAGAGRGAVPAGTPVGLNEPLNQAGPIAQVAAAQPAPATPAAGAVPKPAAPVIDASLSSQDPARVTLGGRAGQEVAGAPGVSKFTQNGKTLFSNVPGDDNDRLLSGKPGVSVVPGLSQATIDQTLTNPDGSRFSAQDNAILAANLRDGIDPYRGTSRQPAQQAPEFINAGKARLAREAQASQNANQGAVRKLEQDKFNLESAGLSLDNESKSTLLAAQRAMLDPKATPAARAAAEKTFQLLSGRAPKEQQNRFTVVPEFDGNGTRIGTTVLDQDGRPVDTRGAQQAQDLPPGLVVGAPTKQPDGSYPVGSKTVTIKNGKVTEIK